MQVWFSLLYVYFHWISGSIVIKAKLNGKTDKFNIN